MQAETRTSSQNSPPRPARVLLALKPIRVVVAAMVVAVTVVWFLFGAVFIAASSAQIFLFTDLSAAQLEPIESFLTKGLVYPVLASVAFLAASLAVRGISRDHVFNGALIGSLGALGAQALLLQFPESSVWEATAYAVFGFAGGTLGGARGRDIRTRGSSREHMNDRVAFARTPEDVIQAFGEHLTTVGARAVFLWRSEKPASDRGDARDPRPRPWESWACPQWQDEPAPGVGPIGDVPASGPDAAPETMVLRPRKGSAESRGSGALWTPHPRAKATMFVALADPAGEPFGVVAAAFVNVGARGAARREFAAAARQASVSLDRMRLAVENREVGERLQRERFKGELHDSALQHMNLAKMKLERLRGGMADDESQDFGDVAEELGEVLEDVTEAGREMRRLVRGGRPVPLESGVHITTALDYLAQDASKRSAVSAAAETTGTVYALPPAVEDEVYWATREALNNVVKHSSATRAKVTLSYFDGLVVLDVMDDGVGPKASGRGQGGAERERDGEREGGDGLRLLGQRIERLGGTLQLEQRTGGGTAFSARFSVAVD